VKAYFLFTPAFLEWPLAMARELQRRRPGSRIAGMATGHRRIAEKVQAAKDVAVAPLPYLDDLEREWLATPVGPGEMARYEAMFGTEALRRLVIADRQVGRGYVSGGILAETEIMRLVRDPENIERYVAGILRYLLRTFESFRPDVVFCYAVAGSQAFALSLVCEHLGIPFGRFNHTRIGKHLIIDDSPLDWLGPVRRRFAEALEGRAPLDDRLAEARRHLGEFRANASSPDYLAVHQKRVARQQSLRSLARTALAAAKNSLRLALGRMELPLRKPTPLRHFLHLARVALRARRLQHQGLFAAPGERPAAPFAFFPLHVDPEASTMVLAPQFTDQLAVIEALSKSLPLGMRLVVKEHIPMLGHRPPGFYERLARIPGVFLASPQDPGIALVREAALTVTITGTAGWEAVVLNKPALILGTPPYAMIGEGFVHCADLSKLPTAVQEALSLAPASDERLALYIAAALDVSFASGTDIIWGKVTEEDVRANPEFLDTVVTRLIAMAEAGGDDLHDAADAEPHSPAALG
jgi:hypothetical protein